MNIIIGNIISLFAASLMVVCGYIKSRKKTLAVQSVQISFCVLSNIFLGGISGVIINLISLPRNLLAYKDKLNITWKIILCILSIVFTLIFDATLLLKYLPIVSNTLYTFLIDKLDDIKFKWLLICTSVLWGIYDICLFNYVMFIFDIGCIVTSLIAIVRLKKKILN